MTLSQTVKDRIKVLVKNDQPFSPTNKPGRITVRTSRKTSDGVERRSRSRTVAVESYSLRKPVVYAEDCFELAYYFKKLGERLQKAEEALLQS
jgi:hypothetical protein